MLGNSNEESKNKHVKFAAIVFDRPWNLSWVENQVRRNGGKSGHHTGLLAPVGWSLEGGSCEVGRWWPESRILNIEAVKVVQMLVVTRSRVRPRRGWPKLGVRQGHGRRVPDTEEQGIGRILCVNNEIIKYRNRDHGGEMGGQ